MLIDFKIRALFIWTGPYLPDLVYATIVARIVGFTKVATLIIA